MNHGTFGILWDANRTVRFILLYNEELANEIAKVIPDYYERMAKFIGVIVKRVMPG